MVKEILRTKFLERTGIENYPPQFAGNIEAEITLDNGEKIKANLYIDWCPAAHKTIVLIENQTAPKEVLEALKDSLTPWTEWKGEVVLMKVHYERFYINAWL